MEKKYANLNLSPLRKYRESLRKEIASGTEANNLMVRFGRRYLAYLRDRFRVNRAGGGEWRPLAAGTIRATERKEGRVGILHVTGQVFNALREGQPGNLFERTRDGIRVGYGGEAKHVIESTGGKLRVSKLTIADIASIHNAGGSRVPRRRIIVLPDEPLRKLMHDDTKRTVERLMRQAQSTPSRIEQFTTP